MEMNDKLLYRFSRLKALTEQDKNVIGNISLSIEEMDYIFDLLMKEREEHKMRFKELVTVIPEDVYFGIVWYEDEDTNKERFWGNITKEDYSEEVDKMVEQFGEYTVTRIEPHKNCLIDDYSSCLNIFVTNLKKEELLNV